AFCAMRTLLESGNTALRSRVLQGGAPILASAKQVENAAAAIAALKKCSTSERELVRLATGATNDVVSALLNMSPHQRAAARNGRGTDWIWSQMTDPAMSTSEAPAESVNVA